MSSTNIGKRNKFSWFVAYSSSAALAISAFRQRRLFWLVPLVIILILLSFILAILSALGPLAPFVYPLL
jgi:hypothetical protein